MLMGRACNLYHDHFFYWFGDTPKLSLNCSRKIKVKMVWGPSLTKAGMKPLKKACGPCLAVNPIKPMAPLNSPGLAFMARVFNTSKGCVNMVAMVP